MSVLVEFHAWVTLRLSYMADDDEDDYKLYNIIEKIKRRIKDSIASIIVKNGEFFLVAHSFSNHLSREYDEFFEIIDFIRKTAPGSYGIMYMFDDEDMQKNNAFKVYVLKKGKLQVLDDIYLSPFFPEVEER